MSQTVPVDAQAYAHMLRELQALRSGQNYGAGLADVIRMRQGVITARDPNAYTVSVRLGASDLSPNTEGSEYSDVIDGVGLAAPVYPRIGDTCFVAMQGAVAAVPTVLFTMGPVGAVRITRASDQGISQAVMSDIVFPSGSGTDVHENTDGMYNAAVRTDGITIGWPGRYTVGGCIRWSGILDTVAVVASLRVGVSSIVELERDDRTGGPFPTNTVAVDVNLAATQVVRLSGFANAGGGGADFQSEYSPMLYATWRSPP